jgi:predicted enzyme related to lactoylglutathione lyase
MFTDAFVTIASTNFDLIVKFYSQLFDSEARSYRPGVYAEFAISGLRLGIFQPKSIVGGASPLENLAKQSGHYNGGMSICLEVSNLEQAIDKLSQLDYPPPGNIIAASHGREIYAYDPDGNCLILHQSPSYNANG